MKLEQDCALLVIDIQQEDFIEMNKSNWDDPRWDCIRNGKRVLDVFRKKGLPVIQIKEVTPAERGRLRAETGRCRRHPLSRG